MKRVMEGLPRGLSLAKIKGKNNSFFISAQELLGAWREHGESV
jgi:hypothetical protein